MTGDGTPDDDDRITYLPIDRLRERHQIYGPTDPRDAKTQGGMRIGDTFVFVADGDMPRLDPVKVAEACDKLVQGKETYAGLLYLARAHIDDIPAVLQATQSEEIRIRWERLWVLSPVLSRLSRAEAGREALLQAFKDDTSGLHLLSKFAEQNNPAVKRLFARMRPQLLPMLLNQLVAQRQEPRRAMLLVSIIANIETDEDALNEALAPIAQGETARQVMGLLYVRYRRGGGDRRLSSAVLRDKLQAWRR